MRGGLLKASSGLEVCYKKCDVWQTLGFDAVVIPMVTFCHVFSYGVSFIFNLVI